MRGKIMNDNNISENEIKEKKTNSDKFSTHKGEFVPVTEDLLKGKIIKYYAEYTEDEDQSEE